MPLRSFVCIYVNNRFGKGPTTYSFSAFNDCDFSLRTLVFGQFSSTEGDIIFEQESESPDIFCFAVTLRAFGLIASAWALALASNSE